MTEIEFGVLGEFPYSIHKHDSLGHLCGYIAVPPSHPWYGKHHPDDVYCHGGVTFANANVYGHEAVVGWLNERLRIHGNSPDSMFNRILRDEQDHTGQQKKFPHLLDVDCWWLGFDCAHAEDALPGRSHLGGEYRDRDFVFAEIENLVRQAGDLVTTP